MVRVVFECEKTLKLWLCNWENSIMAKRAYEELFFILLPMLITLVWDLDNNWCWSFSYILLHYLFFWFVMGVSYSQWDILLPVNWFAQIIFSSFLLKYRAVMHHSCMCLLLTSHQYIPNWSSLNSLHSSSFNQVLYDKHGAILFSIQGTAGVALAGLLGAVRAQGRPMIDFPKMKIVVAGAGRLE